METYDKIRTKINILDPPSPSHAATHNITKNVNKKTKPIFIIGAGPAGLGCAYELLSHKIEPVTILEKNGKVGGLSRTHKFHGRFFDIGPHRFYTNNGEILDLWKKILGPNLINVNRFTRSLYKNKLILYPIQFTDALTKIGIKESVECLISFFQTKLPNWHKQAKSFEDWIVSRFGKKLYNIVFKTYTEKIWGIPCNQIGKEWAAQRIKGIDLVTVVTNAVFGSAREKNRSWVDKFLYPRQGAGQMFDQLAARLEKKGGQIFLKSHVDLIRHRNNKITDIHYKYNGQYIRQPVGSLFSSMPLNQLIFTLRPRPPPNILKAAKKLVYRNHITVNLLINKTNIFPDNWIYIYSPDVKMVRITNFNNFTNNSSTPMKQTAITVEYFAFKKDPVWQFSDHELLELTKEELKKTGLVDIHDLNDGFIGREADAYPIHYIGYQKYLNILKNYLSQFENMQLIGRGATYKYNNMDNAIYGGILAARNYIAGKNIYDVWSLNDNDIYLEK